MFKYAITFFLLAFQFHAIAGRTGHPKHVQSHATQLERIKEMIDQGKFNLAVKTCNNLLKTPPYSSHGDERYNLLQTLTKAHFLDENIHSFTYNAYRAYCEKRQQSKIYLSLYYAQRAAAFHYHIIGDSMVLYAKKSMELLHAHWQDRMKIPFYFVYQIYCNTALYQGVPGFKPTNKLEEDKIKSKVVTAYLDTALMYCEAYPHTQIDKAVIYRSLGSRHFDFLGYKFRSSPSEIEFYDFRMSHAVLSRKYYDLALKTLSIQEDNLRYGILTLKALNYFASLEPSKGEALLWPSVRKFARDPVKLMLPKFQHALAVVNLFARHLIYQNKFDKRIYAVIRILRKLVPYWDLYNQYKNQQYIDTYGYSPNTTLCSIYQWLNSFIPINKATKSYLAELTLRNYTFFSQQKRNQSNQVDKKLFSELLLRSDKGGKNLPLETERKLTRSTKLNVQAIQHQLNDGEAILLCNVGNVSLCIQVLITHNDIYIDTKPRMFAIHEYKLNEWHVEAFKSSAFKLFKQLPFNEILASGRISKLMVAANMELNFDLLITDLSGHAFDQLSYLKKKINVVRIYNPIDYFHLTSARRMKRSVQFIADSYGNSRKLPFTRKFITRYAWKDKCIKPIGVQNFMEQGIHHLVTHSFLTRNKQTGTLTSTFANPTIRWPAKGIKNELIILSTCFAGFNGHYFNPTLDMPNNLISRGAKAIIASPYQTVDQSSALIFEKFYTYLHEGYTAEDALQKAKMDYLKTHNGTLAHPIYWSTYELTTNVKDLSFGTNNKVSFWSWLPLLGMVICVSGTLWWSVRV